MEGHWCWWKVVFCLPLVLMESGFLLTTDGKNQVWRRQHLLQALYQSSGAALCSSTKQCKKNYWWTSKTKTEGDCYVVLWGSFKRLLCPWSLQALFTTNTYSIIKVCAANMYTQKIKNWLIRILVSSISMHQTIRVILSNSSNSKMSISLISHC